jgi:succinyl-CoA synthetase beta subunit
LLSGVAEWLARADTQIIGEGRAKQLLALAGIATPALLEVKSLPEALAAATSIGYPVALKVDDAAIPHKSKVGCLALDLHDADGVCAGFERLARNAATILGGRPVRAFVVEEQSRGGIDLFAGVSRDGELDPVLVVGIGGAIVESGIAVGAARLPLDEEAAERLLARSGLDRALRSAGGGAATAAVADVLNRLSRLAIALGSRLRALDVNPLRVLLNSEAAVVALDALVELERDDAKPGSGSD